MKNIKQLALILLGITMVLLSSCNDDKKKKSSKEDIGLSYEELGLKYAMTTKSVLGKNLLIAINTNGTENALEFCSEEAYPLTDSMAIALNVRIKRVSDKPRNSKNTTSELELEYISICKKKIENGEVVKPKIQEIENKMVGYYPIITNKMCLQCHGKPNTNIESAVLKKINQLYPQDKAIGYDVNQLRGIWVIEMDENINAENEN